MSNLLLQYFDERYKTPDFSQHFPGPVITISREYGCNAKRLAMMLAEQLNKKYINKPDQEKWKVISKEILEESANDLNLHKSKIEYVFNFEKKSTVDDFFSSLSSKRHHSEWKVKETIKKVIRTFGFHGKAIIIGRAGAQITYDIIKSLHIKLVAPVKWRIHEISRRYDLSFKEAAKKVKEMDENRNTFIRNFIRTEDINEHYDIFFNVKTMTSNEITDLIITLTERRDMF